MTIRKKAAITSSPSIKKVPSKFSIMAHFFVGLASLIFIFYLAQAIVDFGDLSFPSALIGIALLLALLVALKRLPHSIALASRPLLSHMVLFFIPAIVGIMAHTSLIQRFPIALLLAIVASTAFSLFVTAWLAKVLLPDEQDKHCAMNNSVQEHTKK